MGYYADKVCVTSKYYTHTDHTATHKYAYVYLSYGYGTNEKYGVIYLLNG